MKPVVTVVGSGASGVHFALTLLRQGLSVRMIDVGRQAQAPVLPAATLNDLKRTLPDPASYFLGERFDGALLPGVDEEFYGIPPSKEFVFDAPGDFRHESAGFAPLFSFARGGLGEVWTAGCYPLNAAEVADFPFDHAELMRCYDEVAGRIGVTGVADDLAPFMPVHRYLQPPLRLDAHGERLMASYATHRRSLNDRGVFMGRTRVATLSQPLGDRQPCDYKGRCLWGCPHGALYTPSQTLRECMGYQAFEYVPGFVVSHLRLAGNRVAAVVARPADGGPAQEFPADRVALAAGALLSTRIFLATALANAGERVRLPGLMDNRQLLVPFVNLGMIGRPFVAESYQYHQLGMGVQGGSEKDYVHGQVTTLKTAMVHPLIQRLPFDLGTSTYLFRAIHAALGLVNVNLRDTRRDGSWLELSEGDEPHLRIHYRPPDDEPARIDDAVGRVKEALLDLGCVVPPGMVHRRPMGASVHYAGTLPMTREARAFTTTPHGESREFENLFMVDGATFPFLPAKNLTFTLMANAVRIATAAFGS